MFQRIYIGLSAGRGTIEMRWTRPTTMTLFAKTLRKDHHVRRYEILPDVHGWRVVEREDSRVLRDAVLSDWHRVERVRRAFDIEMSSLRKEGWIEPR